MFHKGVWAKPSCFVAFRRCQRVKFQFSCGASIYDKYSFASLLIVVCLFVTIWVDYVYVPHNMFVESNSPDRMDFYVALYIEQ
jgi:hypothetical protein